MAEGKLMEIRRFFVEPSDVFEDALRIKGSEFLHLKNVLRLKKGYTVVVSDGSGMDFYAVIEDICKDEAVCRITERRINDTETSVPVTLYVGLPKGGKIDFIVQKAVELGLSAVVPFVSRNSTEKEVNLERLQRIAIEASKQCGRAKIMEVSDIVTFEEVLETARQSCKIMFCEFENKVNFGDFPVKGSTAIITGSEGGFSEAEYAAAKKAGFQGASLGRRILRAETAAVTAAALVLYELGEMKL